jgi:hypothetical protein
MVGSVAVSSANDGAGVINPTPTAAIDAANVRIRTCDDLNVPPNLAPAGFAEATGLCLGDLDVARPAALPATSINGRRATCPANELPPNQRHTLTIHQVI